MESFEYTLKYNNCAIIVLVLKSFNFVESLKNHPYSQVFYPF